MVRTRNGSGKNKKGIQKKEQKKLNEGDSTDSENSGAEAPEDPKSPILNKKKPFECKRGCGIKESPQRNQNNHIEKKAINTSVLRAKNGFLINET